LKKNFVLDACALIAFFTKEPGADKILNLINEADNGNITLIMNQINLLEVYCYMMKAYGQAKANKMLKDVELSPIDVIIGLSDDVLKEAGRMRVTYKLPQGDSIAAAECIAWNGTLVTSDRKDFEMLKRAGKIKTLWFR
jgi:predicted nucleic acid-binding protein